MIQIRDKLIQCPLLTQYRFELLKRLAILSQSDLYGLFVNLGAGLDRGKQFFILHDNLLNLAPTHNLTQIDVLPHHHHHQILVLQLSFAFPTYVLLAFLESVQIIENEAEKGVDGRYLFLLDF